MEEYDPFGGYVACGLIGLTSYEKKKALEAIEWLKKRRISVEKIAVLSMRNIDREGKRILFVTETKYLTIKRVVRYEGSPFDEYITEVFPCLNVEKFVFVHQKPRGNVPTFCGHIRIDRLTEYYGRKRSKNSIALYWGRKYNSYNNASSCTFETETGWLA